MTFANVTKDMMSKYEIPFTIALDHANTCFRLYKSKEGTDMELVCGDQTFKVHSVFLSMRSKFFAAACKGGFKVVTVILEGFGAILKDI